jgi:hypothetical protein
MKKTVLHVVGLATLLSFGLALLYQNSQHSEVIEPSVNSSQRTSTASEKVNEKHNIPAFVPLDKSSNKITISNAELKILTDWTATIGLPFEGTISANGEIVSRSAHSGYESSSDDALRQLAANNDKIAGMVLAERLSEQLNAYPIPPSPELKEILDLLQMVTMRGYTKSIDSLINIKLDQFQRIGIDAHGKSLPSTRPALIEAYEYAYLRKMRGEAEIDSALNLVKRIALLSKTEDMLAQKGAKAIYEKMQQERISAGLPPFNNVIPEEVLNIAQKINQLQNPPKAQ